MTTPDSAAANPADSSALTFLVDPMHSWVGFRVRHNDVGEFRASFGEFTASYTPSTGALEGTAQAASVLVAKPLRERLLQPDFFDAEAHPSITFAAADVSPEPGDIEVTGDLTIRGVTQSVTANGTTSPMSLVRAYDGQLYQHLGIALQATIDRRSFGLLHSTPLVRGGLNVAWTVVLDVFLELRAPDPD